MTLNGAWGFTATDHNWKSQQTVVQMATRVASKGGNLLLNFGPTAEGEIPSESVEIMKASRSVAQSERCIRLWHEQQSIHVSVMGRSDSQGLHTLFACFQFGRKMATHCATEQPSEIRHLAGDRKNTLVQKRRREIDHRCAYYRT